jgi:hypothetical protein
VGVHVITPVFASIVMPAGLALNEYVRVSASGSDAETLTVRGLPSAIDWSVIEEITGAWFKFEIVIEIVSDVVAKPSPTEN